MKGLISIIPLLILALIFGFACTGTGLEVEVTEPKPFHIESLIEDLEDENSNTRESAAMLLGNMGDSQAIEPLIKALKDEDDDVRQWAARALGTIGEPAVEPLFKALEGEGKYVQIRVAMALGYVNDPNVAEFLIEALKNKELKIIAGAYNFFIRRGEEGTEAILIEALNEYGNVYMAEDYLNCGNNQLSKAARTWATSHGYTITEWPIGDSGQSWGANK